MLGEKPVIPSTTPISSAIAARRLFMTARVTGSSFTRASPDESCRNRQLAAQTRARGKWWNSAPRSSRVLGVSRRRPDHLSHRSVGVEFCRRPEYRFAQRAQAILHLYQACEEPSMVPGPKRAGGGSPLPPRHPATNVRRSYGAWYEI